MDIQAQLTSDGAAVVQGVARAVVGQATARLGDWAVAPLQGAFGAQAGSRLLYLVSGRLQGDDAQPWSAVLKVVRPRADADDPHHINYWRRERLLYGSGLLDALPVGLRAPRCYRCDDLADGSLWLWLEHIQEASERPWPLARWALAARHLGQFNGAYLAGRPLPEVPWLGGQRLRTWLERHERLVALIAQAPANPALRHYWPVPIVRQILRLWEERLSFCDALERLPQTFCHGDAIPRNLLSRPAADGSIETVGIDWEYAGFMAAGEEVGQSLSVASAFFHLDPADLPALDEALFAGYLAGLRDAGWHGDERPIRLAYVAHAALRNLFNAVGASLPNEAQRAAAQQNQGYPWEALAERRAAIRPFLLTCASEARGLLDLAGA